MRTIAYLFIAVSFFTLVGCDASGSAQGGGSGPDGGARGHVKFDLPF